MSRKSIAHLALIVLAGLGTIAGASLSWEHLQHGEICPMLGFVPACIVVFLGYLAILLATIFIKKSYSTKLFYVGWTPVFFLALAGVGLELTNGDTCPPGAIGIPQCFYSFAMAVASLLLFRTVARYNKT